jgi:hypothetical protein
MAELSRTAVSGNDWSENELLAYRITSESIPPIQFFSTPMPSLDQLDPALLTASLPMVTIDRNLSKNTIDYLLYLEAAAYGDEILPQKGFIDNFARETLRLTGFFGPNHIVATQYPIPLTICGETCETAQTVVCVVYLPVCILLVLVPDSPFPNGTDAAAQAIAGAIAAFQFNNRSRESRGLAPLQLMTIPCITTSGTCPTFYLVPVSQDLNDAVATGQYPSTQTNVLKCVPLLSDIAVNQQSDSIGMENTEYRKHALQCFLAFRTLAQRYWTEIVEGVHNI